METIACIDALVCALQFLAVIDDGQTARPSHPTPNPHRFSARRSMLDSQPTSSVKGRSRARPSPLGQLYVARRQFDDARLALYRALAMWVSGEHGYEVVQEAQRALDLAQ